QGLLGGIEKTLMLLDQKLLNVPDGAEVLSFIVSGGQVQESPAKHIDEPTSKPLADVALREPKDRYLQGQSAAAMAKTSTGTETMHLRHFSKTFGVNFPMQALTLAKLQEHVNRRAKNKGIRNRPLSPTIIRKEVASLRAAWNWAVQMDFVTGNFPNRGLKSI